MTHFGDRLVEAIQEKGSILCVGLDPQLRYMPEDLRQAAYDRYGPTHQAVAECFWQFNRRAIDAVRGYAAVLKPQMAFYEAYGAAGVEAFERTVEYARDKGLIVVEDAKRGDGGDTAEAYADGHLGEVPFWGSIPVTRSASPIRVDCMTVHGYIGDDCVFRFVDRVKQYGTGIFVVTKTSFKPNSRLEQLVTESGLKVWQELARMVLEWGEGTEGESGYRSVGVVLGATYPEDAPWMRENLPNSWFLVPGYGAQGGGADAAVAAVNDDGLGCIVNSSRGILYSYLKGPHQTSSANFDDAIRAAALAARDELNDALRRVDKRVYL